MTDEQKAAIGNKYAGLKDTYDELFDAVRTLLLEQIEDAPPDGPQHILEMHRGLQNLSKVRDGLTRIILHGQHAEAAIKAALLHRG
jgi:hypothetical protein